MKATATEVKNKFGAFLDRAQHETVIVEKSGRPIAVLISQDEYERLMSSAGQDKAAGTEVGDPKMSMKSLLHRLEKVEAAVGLPSAETFKPRPRRGSGKSHISYVAPDFDASLPEMQEYSQ